MEIDHHRYPTRSDSLNRLWYAHVVLDLAECSCSVFFSSGSFGLSKSDKAKLNSSQKQESNQGADYVESLV